MGEQVFVEWDERYSVNMPVVDDQHKELLRLTNELYLACLKGDETARIRFREVVRSTVDYVTFHFTSEEKIMERVNYPELPAHKREHEAFVKKVFEEVKNFEEGKTFVPNTFVRFLRDWVLTHIAMADKKYSEYIMSLKKQGKLAL